MFDVIAVMALVVGAISAVGSTLWAWRITKNTGVREGYEENGQSDKERDHEAPVARIESNEARDATGFTVSGVATIEAVGNAVQESSARYDPETSWQDEQESLSRKLAAEMQPPLPFGGKVTIVDRGKMLSADIDIGLLVSEFEPDRAAKREPRREIADFLRGVNQAHKQPL